MSSDFLQISLQHWLFSFLLIALYSALLSISLSFRQNSHQNSVSRSLSPVFPVIPFSFICVIFLFMSLHVCLRSQRGTVVQCTVVLVRFVVWPLVMVELQSSGPQAVQKAPPGDHTTRPPLQEPSTTVCKSASSLHPAANFSHYICFCF